MEYCTVVLKQLDETTAEIKTVVNTDVLLSLFRKKKPQEIRLFYENLQMEVLDQLNREFDIVPNVIFNESLGDQQHRTHRGLTPHGHTFVSVLSVVKVLPDGGGLTDELSDSIIQMIQEAMKEDAPLKVRSGWSQDEDFLVFHVRVHEEEMKKVSVDEFIRLSKEALEREIRAERWKDE